MGATLNDPHVVQLIGLLQDRVRKVTHKGIRHVLVNLKEPEYQENLSLRERDEAFGLLTSLDLIVPRVDLVPGTFEVSPLILVGNTKKSAGTRPKKKDWSGSITSQLTLHHQYEQGSCLILEPLGVREIHRKLGCPVSVVSDFFKRHFDGHKMYVRMCRDAGTLAKGISILRGDIRPSILFRALPGNDGRDVPDR